MWESIESCKIQSIFYIFSGNEIIETEIQQRLDKTADLLKDLEQTQYERLSLKPPPHLGSLSGPHEREFELGLYIYIVQQLLKAIPAVLYIAANGFFYAPTLMNLGHIVFALSVCPFVRLSVCLSAKTLQWPHLLIGKT